jgi:hypothetical protein
VKVNNSMQMVDKPALPPLWQYKLRWVAASMAFFCFFSFTGGPLCTAAIRGQISRRLWESRFPTNSMNAETVVQANISEALGADDSGLVWFGQRVEKKGIWDYSYWYANQNLGNFNYGATGAALG